MNRVTYSHDNGVATIDMNDGKVNAMSVEMLRDLNSALDRALHDKAIVVLRSSRLGIFSAGFDLRVFAAKDPKRSLEMVKLGAELALRLLMHPFPTVGVMTGHAYPMGAFLLLACDFRIGVRGSFRMGLNEVAIGIVPPAFAIELARSRVHPAWLSRTVTLGEMYEPDDAALAGFLDRVVAADELAPELQSIVAAIRSIDIASHTVAKRKLRQPVASAMRVAIDDELTSSAYETNAAAMSAVTMPRQR